MQSKQYHVYNAKPTGLSNGATPPMSVLPNAWLHLPLLKVFSSRALSAPYFGSKSEDFYLASALAMNWSVVMKASTATSHASFTPNYSTAFPKHVSSKSSTARSSSKWFLSFFVVDTLPVELIGMNSSMMCNYIKFCADRLLIALGYQRHYKIGNLFECMEMISLQGETNFFEKRVGEYLKSGVGVDKADQIFALDTSFWPPLFSAHTLVLHPYTYIYMLHNTLFPVGNTRYPPILTTFASVALRRQYTQTWWMHTKSPMSFFGVRDSHPFLPKRTKP